jgi:hypothetical protein
LKAALFSSHRTSLATGFPFLQDATGKRGLAALPWPDQCRNGIVFDGLPYFKGCLPVNISLHIEKPGHTLFLFPNNECPGFSRIFPDFPGFVFAPILFLRHMPLRKKPP